MIHRHTAHQAPRGKKAGTQRAATSTAGRGTGENRMEGEGSRTAARRYDAAATAAAADVDRTEALAEEAKRALESPEGKELREADEKGKSRRR